MDARRCLSTRPPASAQVLEGGAQAGDLAAAPPSTAAARRRLLDAEETPTSSKKRAGRSLWRRVARRVAEAVDLDVRSAAARCEFGDVACGAGCGRFSIKADDRERATNWKKRVEAEGLHAYADAAPRAFAAGGDAVSLDAALAAAAAAAHGRDGGALLSPCGFTGEGVLSESDGKLKLDLDGATTTPWNAGASAKRVAAVARALRGDDASSSSPEDPAETPSTDVARFCRGAPPLLRLYCASRPRSRVARREVFLGRLRLRRRYVEGRIAGVHGDDETYDAFALDQLRSFRTCARERARRVDGRARSFDEASRSSSVRSLDEQPEDADDDAVSQQAIIDGAAGAEVAARVRGAARFYLRDGADAALATLGGALDAKVVVRLNDAGLEEWRGGFALDAIEFFDASPSAAPERKTSRAIMAFKRMPPSREVFSSSRWPSRGRRIARR